MSKQVDGNEEYWIQNAPAIEIREGEGEEQEEGEKETEMGGEEELVEETTLGEQERKTGQQEGELEKK